MRQRTYRSLGEVLFFMGVLLLTMASIAQIVITTQRSSFHSETLSARNVHPSAGWDKLASKPPLTRRGKNRISIQDARARMKARSKAAQEVRELERSLIKMMRLNSRTPEQSNLQLWTELYGRRVSRIIQEAADSADRTAATFNSASNAAPALSEQENPFIASAAATAAVPGAMTNDQPIALNSGRVVANRRRTFSDSVGQEQRKSLSDDNFFHESSDVDNKNLVPYKASLANLGRDNSQGAIQYSKHFKDGILSRSENYHNKTTDDHGRSRLNSIRRGISSNDKSNFSKTSRVEGKKLELCPKEPAYLVGNMTDVNLTLPLDIDDIMAEHADVLEGGEWSPADCVPRHRVAFVIPYRDRWSHLKSLLYYLIPILKRQQIHFRMFVVEQFGNDTFNKGRIMNAAFREALKLFDFQCVTFHDVDLVPEDDRNMYSCVEMPKHMSIAIDKFDYHLPYEGLVGGVLMFKTEHFQQVNGYSNMYWGWGAEDDDMTTRILHQGLRIYRPPSTIARYKMVKHDGRKVSEVSVRMRLLRSAARRSKMEGLNNVQYEVLYTHLEKLFTHFLVDIGHP